MDKHTLEQLILSKGVTVKLYEALKGGTVSQVYTGIMDTTAIVVKHTDDYVSEDKTEVPFDKKSNTVDTHVLRLLADSTQVKVPKVHYMWEDITTTVMDNLHVEGYTLLTNLILDRKFPLTSAAFIGKSIAHFLQEARTW